MAFFRRKQMIIERGMQLRFARFVVVYMIVCCVVTAGIVFFATFALLGEKIAEIYPQNRLPAIYARVYLAFFASLAASMPILFYGALQFSHRIAGPLPKIYRALGDIGNGDFSVRLTLRKKDELKELAEHINRMADKLAAREKGKPNG